MGEIMLMMGFLDNPDLVRATINHLAELWAALYDRVVSEVKVDCIHIWEDMSYKNGLLIRPEMFKEFMVPAYRKVTSVARSHGVKTIFVDTDGDCLKLIPHFMDGGVTGLYPRDVKGSTRSWSGEFRLWLLREVIFLWSTIRCRPMSHGIIISITATVWLSWELEMPWKFQKLIDQAYEKEWVMYVKKLFSGPKQVLQYLGKYTHRVVRYNLLIIDVRDCVRFLYRRW